MNTLMLIKNIKMGNIAVLYFNSEEEAILTWRYITVSDEWEIIYLKERKPNGHQYKLTYTKKDGNGNLYSKDIICFTKKEAIILKNKIERTNQNYITQIKKNY